MKQIIKEILSLVYNYFIRAWGKREKNIIKQKFWECVVNEKRNFYLKKMELWEKIIPFIPEDYFFGCNQKNCYFFLNNV
jgi:hypothetical protein